jgi:signal transduction histidine kinase
MGRKRADGFSQIAITQDMESNELRKHAEFTSEVMMSLYQTFVTVLDASGNHIEFWEPSNLDEQYGIRCLGGDLAIDAYMSSEDISRWKKHVMTVFETGESIRGEYPLYFPKGEFWFDITISPIWGPRGEISAVLTLASDISALKERIDQLLHMYHDLQLYTSLLRHDLSNDIQVILTETEVSEIKDSNQTDLLQMRDMVKASAERMARVLRAFEASEELRELEVVQLLKNAARQGETIHQNLRVIVKSTPDAQKAKVSGGRLLPMVFDNILRNAAQHGGENPEVRIMVTLIGRAAQIDISDNGPGIPHEIRKTVFRIGHGRSGLSLCKRIIERCGGSISLLENQNYGTSFRIELPLIR